MKTRQEKLDAFGRILDILDELRVKCPWDRKQTNESLRPQTIEETYELSDAILKADDHEISKELGDVLLHVLFYSKMGEEKGLYDDTDSDAFRGFDQDDTIPEKPELPADLKKEEGEEFLATISGKPFTITEVQKKN